MKLNRLMCGIILLFIGGVLLLENFNWIEFYWRNVLPFWPVIFIIAGINILFNKNKSQLGSVISIVILIVTLGVLFYKGQETPRYHFYMRNPVDLDDADRVGVFNFSQPYTDAAAIKTRLNISGGGTSFELKGITDSLITAAVEKRGGTFSLINQSTGNTRTLTFKMKGGSKWNLGEEGNDVDLRLNRNPYWEIHINMGAGEVDFDLSPYKVREFNFDGGAAALDIKLGDSVPVTDVNIKTGVADVKISVPYTSGCRIKAKTGLSSREFTGFIKSADGGFETPNYQTSVKKIFINLDGGLSNFEVKRYHAK